jgi:outer membrane biosynthesis protein TonB
MSLREVLRELSAKHSYVDLHKELLGLMREEYSALNEFFSAAEKKPRQRKPVPEAQHPVPEAQHPVPEETVPHKMLANTKIRIIKKASAAPAPAPAPEPATAPAEPDSQEKPRMNSKELKAWQREQEAKKLAELKANGITPESLLTAENIKRWIEGEHRTFAYVAREYVGMPEDKVADFAKGHGVKSSISKKRAILSAKNRHL